VHAKRNLVIAIGFAGDHLCQVLKIPSFRPCITASRCAAARSTRASHSSALHSSRLMHETWNCTLISLLLTRGSYGGDTKKYHAASARSSPVHAIALLRARRERPRDNRATEQRDELAPFHSITSSAVPSSVAGTSSPRTLAVCRLKTNSNFAARITGRSAGFSPLRTRPV